MEKLNLYLLFVLISLIEEQQNIKSNKVTKNKIDNEDELEKHPFMPSN